MGPLLNTVEDAVAAIASGGIVVLPTETVYGLAAKPDANGVAKIFAVKERPPDKSLQLLIPDATWLDRTAHACDAARALAAAFWPGPLTLVVRANDDAPSALVSDGTIGLRQPDHPFASAVLSRTGPLAASSANRSGDPTPSTVEEIRDLFGDRVDAYVDGGTITGAASTVVSVSDGRAHILRHGALDERVVKSAIEGRFERP